MLVDKKSVRAFPFPFLELLCVVVKNWESTVLNTMMFFLRKKKNKVEISYIFFLEISQQRRLIFEKGFPSSMYRSCQSDIMEDGNPFFFFFFLQDLITKSQLFTMKNALFLFFCKTNKKRICVCAHLCIYNLFLVVFNPFIKYKKLF